MEEHEKPAIDGEKIAQQNHPDPLPPAPSQVAKPEGPTQHKPATSQQLEEVKEKMSAFERSTLKWARVAVIVSGLAFVVVCAQWWEMHTSGTDTHNLAVAAGNQATWTQNLATNMQRQADRTKDLADRMKDQADQAKTIAGQAVVQASAAKESADATVAANRAWMVPEDNSDPQTGDAIQLGWKNAGATPAVYVVMKAEDIAGDPTRLTHRLRPGVFNLPELIPEFAGGCDAVAKRSKSMTWTSTVLAGQTWKASVDLSDSPIWKEMPESGPPEIGIHGCVWYVDVLTNLTRTTEFCFQTIRISGTTKYSETFPCGLKRPFDFR